MALGRFIVPKPGGGEATLAGAALLPWGCLTQSSLTAVFSDITLLQAFVFHVSGKVCIEHFIYTGPSTNDLIQYCSDLILWNQIGLLYLKTLKSKPHLNCL